jgi:alpha-L-arabinofuranosidase
MNKLTTFLLTALLLSAIATLYADETSRVVIDTKQTGTVISPLLFGHNMETTRDGVWRGIGAEMVANRKFADEDKGMPKQWTTTGGGGRVAIDDSHGYAGKQSVRLEIPDGGKSCGIAQEQETMVFKKGTKYALRVWLKSDAARTLKARILDRASNQVVFETEHRAGKGDWELIGGEFMASATTEKNRLEIGSQEAGVFWIGAVSLKPSDTFHGMRRDVIELLKRIKPGSLRWPGGCYAEFYRWQEGLLPVDQRPPVGPTGLDFMFLAVPGNGDYDTHEIGIDEFIALCGEVGSEPAITVRLSENSPEDAAALVEYCNGGLQTKWGKVRAQRGHSAPYRVKCWFVGNELYSFGRGGLTNAEVCARQTKLFAQAMKKADPTIQLTGCTQSGGGNWNKMMIEQAGEALDLYSAHDYLLDRFTGDLPGIAKAPTQSLRPLLQNARASFQRDVPAGRRFGIAFDEWNTRWGLSGSVGMGLYAAGVLNLLCREAESLAVQRAYYFMPVNEGAIQVTPLEARLDKAGEVFELFKVHQGNRLLKTAEMPPDADLDLCATLTPDGKCITVTVVNRNTTNECALELSLNNFTGPANASARFLVPLTLEVGGNFAKHDEQLPVMAGKNVELKLPPCCIARIHLEKGKP